MEYEKRELKPTNDFVFKTIFGQEDSKICLISLLNAILDGNPVIKDVTILNPDLPRYDQLAKESRLDVAAQTDDGTIVNVEIQCVDTGDLESRSIVYASKLITKYTLAGQSYNRPKVIGIWIIRDKIIYGPMASRHHPIEEVLTFLKPNASDNYYTQFHDKMRIIFVHLSRFKDEKLLKTFNEILQNWIVFLEKPENIQENKEDEAMKKAQYKWLRIAGDEKLKNELIERENYAMDKGSELDIAREEGLIEGEKRGIEKGLKEGEKKGIEKGLIEGEKRKMTELALNMKKQGFENEVIAKCLNISIDEMNTLMNEVN